MHQYPHPKLFAKESTSDDRPDPSVTPLGASPRKDRKRRPVSIGRVQMSNDSVDRRAKSLSSFARIPARHSPNNFPQSATVGRGVSRSARGKTQALLAHVGETVSALNSLCSKYPDAFDVVVTPLHPPTTIGFRGIGETSPQRHSLRFSYRRRRAGARKDSVLAEGKIMHSACTRVYVAHEGGLRNFSRLSFPFPVLRPGLELEWVALYGSRTYLPSLSRTLGEIPTETSPTVIEYIFSNGRTRRCLLLLLQYSSYRGYVRRYSHAWVLQVSC